MVDNGYSKVNIFKGIKDKKETPKKRVFIDKDIREKIFNYFIEKNAYNHLAICYLTFYGLIRPKEICLLKVDDFDFKYNYIRISENVSKNDKERIVTMPQALKNVLLKIEVQKVKKDCYVFGKGLIPNIEKTNRRYIAKFWAKMRIDLGLGNEYQFYGLKDTGIIEMLRAGVSPEAVRDQAGHGSLSMTNRYVKIARTGGDNQIIDKVNF